MNPKSDAFRFKSRRRFFGGAAKGLVIAALVCVLIETQTSWSAETSSNRYFVIQVTDEQTGRGVPLVELRTVSNLRFYTDSNGLAAIDDPALMNQTVYFSVSSDGYEFAVDGFGNRGRAFHVKPGGEATVKLKRLNVAERLYRVTGNGIYRDTVAANRKAPIREPLLNAKVVGQDTVQALPYNGKLYWFWGDTNRLGYPLGHFGTAGAMSELPSQGGLDPAVGVDLSYFVDSAGFSKPTCDVPGPGPKWIDGLMVVKDELGRDRLVAKYNRMKSLGEVLERGLVQWDDVSETWKPLVRFELNRPLYPSGQPFRFTDGGVDYFYFPGTRVRADLKSITDPAQYEAFTCLAPASRYEKGSSKLDRRPDGSVNWVWKRDTSRVGGVEEDELIKSGLMKPRESQFLLHDPQSHRTVVPHAGSVCFNSFRKKWIQIVVEIGGENSFLGEVWYAESEAPVGPWYWARRIVTHNKYSFYNPVQHPVFDQEGGRFIYFEGTYTNTFSGNENPTPLYDYNQMMYRLDLADPRLQMPVMP
jgi:hypothetical protein